MFADSLKFTAHNRKNNLVYLLLISTPVFIFYSLFFHFLKNIPYIDDFYWYFNFVDQVDQAPTFLKKLTVFLTPYNDHRHYFQRLFILLSVYLFGEINIAFFILLGNITFLVFIYNFFRFTLKNAIGIVFSVWLFFQPISFMNYYSFAFFNLPVLLFSLLCIRSIVQQANLLWIISLGLLATFSNANGLLVWVLGIIISFIQANYKRLFSFIFILVSLLILFFLQNVYLQTTPAETGRTIDIKLFIDLILFSVQIYANFIDWAAYGLPWMAIPVGLIILFLFGRILLNGKSIHKNFNQSYTFYFLLFLALSMALISIGRSSMDGLIAYVTYHHRFYPCIFLGCLIYYYATTRKLTKIVQYGLVLIGIGITVLNYKVYLPLMDTHFNHELADALNYTANKKWLFYPIIQGRKEYEFVNAISNPTVSKKFYATFEPQVNQESTLFKSQLDSLPTKLILQVHNTTYSPITENAFCVVKCGGFTYFFPVLFDRSWKDVLKLQVQQPIVTAVIDWKTMHEPCLSRPDTIQYAVLRGKHLTYYPLSLSAKKATY